MSLFTFRANEDQSSPGADLIIPSKQHINVVTDYAWTIQPKSARQDVPYLYMIERKLTNNVMIQQLLYNLSTSLDLSQEIAADVKKVLSMKNIFGDERAEAVRQLSEERSRQEKIEKQIGENKGMFVKDQPYMGLYDLEDTGWSYILPYFDKQNHNISGSWGLPGDADGGFQKIGTVVRNAFDNLAGGVNQITSLLGVLGGASAIGAKVGTYIEKAKQYNFQAAGPKYSLEFNLFNTGKLSDVIDNWELCFALMYNLLPNRRTKTVFDPPPLYEIHIPGVRRSPISFIAGMQVNFLGATRLMDLEVAGKESFRTIVPDAYSVKIDVEDVLPESKNFMQSMVDEKKLVRVTRAQKKDTRNVEGQATRVDVNTETIPRAFADEELSKYNGITRISLN